MRKISRFSYEKTEILITLYNELGARLRFRSESEHIYTAATLAGFGAVSWGVLSLHSYTHTGSYWSHPAIVAAMGVIFVAMFVIWKIVLEHCKYTVLKKEQADIAQELISLLSIQSRPLSLINNKVGFGAWLSASIVAVAGFGAVLICFVTAGV